MQTVKIESSAEQISSTREDLTIYDLIAAQASRNPTAIAIAAPDRTPLTYSRLDAQINCVVKTLNTMGLGRGDRIAIVLPNGPEMAVAFLAVSATATSAPVNPALNACEFDFYLRDLNPQALIVQSGIESPARAVAQALNIPLIELVPILEAQAGIFRLTGDFDAPAARNSFAQKEDSALVLHTGNASQPKLVPLTQSDLCTSAHNIKTALDLADGDRCLNVMPLFDIHGLSAILCSLSAGASVVCTPGFDAAKFSEWSDSLHPTWYTALPTMHQAILKAGAQSNLQSVEQAGLDSITQLLAQLEALSHEDAQQLLANGMRFKQALVQQDVDCSTKVLQSQLDYWKQQLSGNLPTLDLPTDRPRPPILSFQNARHFLKLPLALTGALKQLSQQEGVTLYMTLLAAFNTLLHRYSGQSDILVGSPIANRNSVETKGLTSFFVNTLVMRTDLSGNPTFQKLLAAVREVALGAYAHQDVPFEKLVEELLRQRDSSRSPLFQVMFALQNATMPEMADLTLSSLDIDSATSKLDLTLSMHDTEQGLVGVWEYNTDLFDATTITRMAENFQILLEGIVAHPQERVSHLPLLSADERQTLLVSWNRTEAEYSLDVCIHQLFEAAVSRTPDKVAVVFENEQLTYAQLNQQAGKLASYLTSCGVGGETFVGICLERSLFMVVGLLAILKAGGTYVPIDPRYPQERIAFVLEDTNAPVLLTQASVVASLPTSNARVICLDTDWEVIATEDKQNILASVTPENLAYVIYTSGSTGKPKGVQIEHRAVVNFLTSMKKKPGLTDQDILLSVTTLSFDIAVLEIFLPLTVGASLVIASADVTYSGVALQQLLLDSGATIMQATPATMRLLHEAGWRGKSDLKILCGGEAMPKALALQLLARVGSLWNMYGPTETTIWSTVHQVEEHSLVISIGRPIANTSTLR